MSLRTALKSLLPPLALAGYRFTKRLFVAPQPAEWSVLPDWPNRAPDDGWSHQSILAAQVRKWPAFCAVLDGHGPLGVAHEADDPHAFDVGAQNTVMCFAYVLARVAGARESIAMLDWGCGLGHYARLAKALLPESNIRYVGKDFPLLTAAASERNPDAQFFSDDEQALAQSVDLVMASGSLHYARDWRAVLARLTACARDSLYVARLPTLASVPSFVVVQRPHRWGYLTEYHGWFINRAEFLDAVAQAGFQLEREFLSHESPTVPGAPQQCEYRGFWFRRISAQ